MISVSIVTFNSARVVGECLESLAASLDPGQSVAVTVVDNGSADRTLEVVEAFRTRARPDFTVDVIRSPENLGYGKGHNLAFRDVKAEYHVICNPDIVFRGNTLHTLREYIEAHRDIGILCPLVLNEDLTPQYLNKRLPTVLDLFLRRFLPGPLRPLFRRRLDHYEMRDTGYDRVIDVPFVSGAFMFCRSEALRRAGGFDPRYFLYFEDVDLSRAVQAAGYRTVFLPEASVIHLWAREHHKSVRLALAFVQNGIKYFGKWGWKLL